MSKNCTICGKPVDNPGITERAAKEGMSTIVYQLHFPRHADCELQKRREEAEDLMRRQPVVRHPFYNMTTCTKL